MLLSRSCLVACVFGLGFAACDPGTSDDGDNTGSGGTAGGTGFEPAGGHACVEIPAVPDDGKTPVERWGQLRVEGANLVDSSGGFVQLKGPSSMWLNWEDSGFADSLDGLRFMRDDWKATVIRIAMGIEPANAYLAQPDIYKAQVRAILDNAIELGMYAIVDWHDHTAHEHQDEAVAFFAELAKEYGDKPNVLYETYNEPTQVSWPQVVKPYHEAVVAAIRAEDPDNIIILGTTTWAQDVNLANSSPVAGTNLMYNLHFYSCSHGGGLRSRADNTYQQGLPIFVTEWGATNSDGGTTGELCLEEAQLWHDMMRCDGISWTAWKWDDCPDLSCYFQPGTPTSGGWTDDQLNGHGAFVRDRMRE